MKIKEGLILRNIAGSTVVVSTGEASLDFYGMIKLNQTGKVVWEGIDKGLSEKEVVLKLLDEYDVEKDIIESDVHNMINQMYEAGFLVDE